MPELNTEAEAESLLLSAVMAPDAQDVDERTPTKAETDLDDPTQIDEPDDETEEKVEAKEAKEQQQADPEEDEIEIPGEDGEEPTRLKLKDVLAGYQEHQRFESQKAQIIENVERQAVEAATGQLRQIEQAGKQTAYMIQAALRVLQPPQPPDINMRDPRSQNYDPDRYEVARFQYEQAMQAHNQAQGVAQQLMQQAQQAEAQAREVRETRELQRLQRAWPEFGQPETTNKFIEDMSKAYGFTAQELDDVLVDHRQALVARDALAFRAMKAQSGDVKAKVEAKAPKLVRTKQEAKGSAAQARDTGGRFASDAKARLAKSHSDDDAAAFFTGLVKAGRI
jgi:hypothetical protein